MVLRLLKFFMSTSMSYNKCRPCTKLHTIAYKFDLRNSVEKPHATKYHTKTDKLQGYKTNEFEKN